jgi:2-methylisocitrate lyase-like PEP mutase family enzyme
MTREKADVLRRLHAGPSILLFPNAWDVASARIVEQAGFPAVATSSAGVANVLGYADGERISRAEMLDMVRRIAASVAVPVTADMEAGYGVTAEAAAETARGVIAAGAVGMNLEDAKPEGALLPMEVQVERVRAARAAAPHLVINARTDSFPKAGIEEAIRRANAYLAAGADCAFVPFVADREAIARLAREIRGPLNVLGTPASPPLADLQRMGVRRVSLGSGPSRVAYGRLRQFASELKTRGTWTGLGEGAVTYAEMQALFGVTS